MFKSSCPKHFNKQLKHCKLQFLSHSSKRLKFNCHSNKTPLNPFNSIPLKQVFPVLSVSHQSHMNAHRFYFEPLRDVSKESNRKLALKFKLHELFYQKKWREFSTVKRRKEKVNFLFSKPSLLPSVLNFYLTISSPHCSVPFRSCFPGCVGVFLSHRIFPLRQWTTDSLAVP